MSIHWRNGCRDLLIRAFDIYGRPLGGLKMLELGNQRLKFDPSDGVRGRQNAKPFFEFFGIRHISLDINARGGAIGVDLRQPVDWEALRATGGWGQGEADMVTNFGTSEHVSDNQFQVFKTVHDACRFGGLMVHAVPRVDSCRRHGVWKYDAHWLERLACQWHYKIEYLTEWDKSEHWTTKRIPRNQQFYVLAVLRKVRSRRRPAEVNTSTWPGDPTRQR